MEPFQFWRSWTCLRREHSQQSQQLPLGRAGTWRFPCLSNDVAIMIFFSQQGFEEQVKAILSTTGTWFRGAWPPPCQDRSSAAASSSSSRRHSSVSHSGPKRGNRVTFIAAAQSGIFRVFSPLPHVPCWVPGRSSLGDPTPLRSWRCGMVGTRSHTWQLQNNKQVGQNSLTITNIWRGIDYVFCKLFERLHGPTKGALWTKMLRRVSPKFTLVLLILNPEAFGLEGLAIEEDEVALAVLLGPVAQRGDHDVAVREAVGGVRGPHSQCVHLPRLDDLGYRRVISWRMNVCKKEGKESKVKEWQQTHLVQLGVEGIRLHVHNVHSVWSQGRNNQPLNRQFKNLLGSSSKKNLHGNLLREREGSS